jgi:O-acetyl-ADP-ribose deacetylase (regulator of RNase III)
MKFYLRDRNELIVESWEKFFKDNEEFHISAGDIFDISYADAIVSPANSFGLMTGGIDAVYIQKFGVELQDRLRNIIRQEYYGELPVGQAIIVPTGDENYPWLISAPTMRVPGTVKDTVNAYLAFRAVLLAIKQWNAHSKNKIESILCPGLGSAIGEITPFACACQMHEAYKAIWQNDPALPLDCSEAWYGQQRLLGWSFIEGCGCNAKKY